MISAIEKPKNITLEVRLAWNGLNNLDQGEIK